MKMPPPTVPANGAKSSHLFHIHKRLILYRSIFHISTTLKSCFSYEFHFLYAADTCINPFEFYVNFQLQFCFAHYASNGLFHRVGLGILSGYDLLLCYLGPHTLYMEALMERIADHNTKSIDNLANNHLHLSS